MRKNVISTLSLIVKFGPMPSLSTKLKCMSISDQIPIAMHIE